MGTVANTNWGTNWSKPSIWCLEAAERRGRMNGLMDWWMGGGAWEDEWGRGKWGHLVFLNCLNSQPNCSMLDRTDSRSSSCISNQSISNLFVSWWIDWLEDRLAGWDPNYLHLVDFWGGKLISKPMRIHLLFTMELWVIWGQKITLLDASVGLDLILLQAGIKQRGCSCGLKTVSRFSEQWMWRENKVTWLQLASELNRCLVERSDQVSMKATDYTLKSLFCLKDQETTPMVRQSQEKHNRLDWTLRASS